MNIFVDNFSTERAAAQPCCDKAAPWKQAWGWMRLICLGATWMRLICLGATPACRGAIYSARIRMAHTDTGQAMRAQKFAPLQTDTQSGCGDKKAAINGVSIDSRDIACEEYFAIKRRC
jgi:hypothetical protein